MTNNKGHSLVWEEIYQPLEKVDWDLVAEKRHESLDPVVKLVVAEGHCVKVEQAVEPALHNLQLST